MALILIEKFQNNAYTLSILRVLETGETQLTQEHWFSVNSVGPNVVSEDTKISLNRPFI